jgi:hypothetical protein
MEIVLKSSLHNYLVNIPMYKFNNVLIHRSLTIVNIDFLQEIYKYHKLYVYKIGK